jgi:hypothetical protein
VAGQTANGSNQRGWLSLPLGRVWINPLLLIPKSK